MNSAIAKTVLAAAMAVAMAGCQSTDPAAEMDLAAALVQDRTGRSPEWDAPAGAGDWDVRSPLTAAQAVRIALRNNRSIRSDLTRIAAARADMVQAGLPPNPTLSSMFMFAGNGGSMITGGAMQTLSTLWLIPSRTRAAHALLQQTVLRVTDTTLNLAARTEQTCSRVVYSQNVLALYDLQQRNFERALRAARTKFEAGMGTSLDVNRLEAEMLLNQVARRSARLELDREKRTLLELMGLADASADWTVTQTTTPAIQKPLQPDSATTAPIAAGPARDRDVPARTSRHDSLADEPSAVALARSRRLDLLAARWTLQAQAHALRGAKLGALPEVSLGAGVERDTTGMGTMTAAGPGVNMTLPIFDRNQARIARARAELAKAQADAETADQLAVRQVRQAFTAAQAACEQLLTYADRVLPLAEKNLQQAQDAFNAAEVDLLEVLSAERTLTQSRLEMTRQNLDMDIARSELARATGGLLSDLSGP
ncbi:MAG TPA: TolC family protein [Phycisphaerae bacterium]|nr:TolC family protein [Phycisphaerae bacterium]HQL74616.1 TolC family protein [Phycisphaerae bacterium]